MERSAFDDLLTPGGTFYRAESLRLARLAVRMRVPPSYVEDVVAEVWRVAVEYRGRFAAGDVEQRLHGWLGRVVRSMAVDALRRLGRHACLSLGSGHEELIDRTEARRAEAAEQGEWLAVLLEKVCAGKEEDLRLVCGHFLERRSLQELAHEFGIKACAVDGRIRRLLKELRERTE